MTVQTVLVSFTLQIVSFRDMFVILSFANKNYTGVCCKIQCFVQFRGYYMYVSDIRKSLQLKRL